jgi:hypothetical protein
LPNDELLLVRTREVEVETYVTRRQEHLDEHVQQVGRGLAGSIPVNGPLVDDAGDEVPEDGLHEEDLREELGPDELGTLEVEVVEDLEADGEGHLQDETRKSQFRWRGRRVGRATNVNDAHHNRHLHLKRDGKDEDVVGTVPSRVDTEEVPRSCLERLNGSVVVSWPAPLRRTEVEREGEDVVVDETGVDGEELREGRG